MEWRQVASLVGYVGAAIAAVVLLHWHTRFFDHSADLLALAQTPYGRDPSNEQLDKIARVLAGGKPMDPSEFGECSSTLQTLQDAQGWCKRVQELHVCSERLREAQAERCSASELEGSGKVALRLLGDTLRRAVELSLAGRSQTELNCIDGPGGYVCTADALQAECNLQPVSHGKNAISLCAKLIPTHGCIFYAYGVSQDHSSDVKLAERFGCSGLAFDPASSRSFAMHKKVAFFQVGGPMVGGMECSPLDGNCTEVGFETAGPATVSRLSGHKRLSVLRLDCGGCEYQLALDVLAGDPEFFHKVDQVFVQVHSDKRAASSKHVTSLGLLLVLFEQAGLQMVQARLRPCGQTSAQSHRPCPPLLKDAGFFCDDKNSCVGLLFARIGATRSASNAITNPAQQAAAPASPIEDLPSPKSGDMFEREKYYRQACDDARPGGYAGLQVIWSPEEQEGLCGGCMLLGNFYSSNPDWQKTSGYGSRESEGVTGKYTDCAKTRSCTPVGVSMDVMRMYYESVKESGCCCTLLHDGAFSTDFQTTYRTDRVRFLQVDALKLNTQFNRKFGLNDARYFGMHEAFCAHKNWQRVFFSDIFDVKIGSSPCTAAEKGTLYIGTDNAAFASPFLERRFKELGQTPLEFFQENLKQETQRPMWSAGIVGAGDRETMEDFLAKLLAVLTDPEMPAVKKGEYQGVNMAAVNYVAERFFRGRTRGGPPLNSKYRGYERKRRDVWFIHK